MRYLVSFIRSPLGFMLNLLATVLCHMEKVPGLKKPMMWCGDQLSWACEVICLRDGVQDDMLF